MTACMILLTDEGPAQDPLHIPSISRLIERSKLNSLSRRDDQSKATRWVRTTLSSLPLEVVYVILDNLDFEELGQLRIATSLPVGENYWRGRLPRAIIFEFENILDESGIRWDHLTLEAEQLMAFCPALVNRQRCLTGLHKARGIFWAKLNNQERGIQSPQSWPCRSTEACLDAAW